MSLLQLQDIQLAYGDLPLLDHANLVIEKGERLCLVGRNGTGKSTLLKVIAGEAIPEDGKIERGNTRISRLKQEVPKGTHGTIYDVTAEGVGEIGTLIADYHHLILQMATDHSDAIMNKMAAVQQKIEAADGWSIQQQIETTLSKMGLEPEEEFSSLSGGMKRRVLLAQALVQSPDLLLLDEPTNHLDIESIQWLEDFLINSQTTLLFITHDRQFLRRLATRIIELDRGILTDWPGNYDSYLQLKEQALEEESRNNALFDKKLAQEEVWIRQGIKARRTRNEGRVRALKKLRQERSERRNRSGNVVMATQQSDASGKKVIRAKEITHSYDGQRLVNNLSLKIQRGDRIGIIGPNGVGKSTLLRILLGETEPQQGSVVHGTKLQVAYFDQLRNQLNEELSVQDNVADGSDNVVLNGRSKHVISYLQDFLFSPQRARSPVSTLSGGERNRLLLARLFSKPANLLVMDEPTNDLDVETLELLEELLLEYEGTLLLVSHDRAFVNNVVTSTLVFEGEGTINEYVGGYDDWVRQRKEEAPKIATSANKPPPTSVQKPAQKKLSYKERLELEALPKKIEQMEAEQEQLHQKLADPSFYQSDADAVTTTTEQLKNLEQQLSECYARWEQLEEAENG
ncbi:MAG: ATP-binding cassette domain-containing protein [Gammaproteobacteria bacterium]|jgi:ATP-binding cassette subfamily F protein uup|nr:ATP-binding cassette domain-containing protein [Gammaproteobacteria bacterium]MBT4606876.1 ATP-binding cassette domain-containing protein [Thiotrichales bacterium]MBT3473355.1 ATP-binding cassette domain-containing protein [Gammaproteobacteria bacterium]MBT4080758.1 ATP-binding cassette domain-containing protein [Gammaproteobacteria bacterium]MBT4328486.1 ATP-binding cassette domain-containing protein [Gammaproteobacteria bacterium]